MALTLLFLNSLSFTWLGGMLLQTAKLLQRQWKSGIVVFKKPSEPWYHLISVIRIVKTTPLTWFNEMWDAQHMGPKGICDFSVGKENISGHNTSGQDCFCYLACYLLIVYIGEKVPAQFIQCERHFGNEQGYCYQSQTLLQPFGFLNTMQLGIW